MPLTLFLHPLSSFCQKALIALYENGTQFTPHSVDLGDPAAAAAFKAIWPVGQFPVLREESTRRVVGESTSIIEYLARHHPGPVKLIPENTETALEVRAQDRFFDLHIHVPMQKIIGNRLRPEGHKDGFGVEDTTARLKTALGMAERTMATRTWAAGEAFSMADCAAAPALFYVDMTVLPLAGAYGNLAAYLDRLKQRPSFARALAEAKPYLHLVPR
jgi:glutathione S-transferase